VVDASLLYAFACACILSSEAAVGLCQHLDGEKWRNAAQQLEDIA
jgi:hypothetical protein